MSEPLPELLEKIDARHLPSLPHILLKLLDICHSEEPTFEDLCQILDKDTTLTARIISVGNSSLYGRPTKITSLERALIALGLETVKTIAVSAAVYQVFSQIGSGSGFNLKRFWWHSLSCATVARLLAAKTAYPFPDEAYLAGLLQDIGQLVLWVNFPKDYGTAMQTEDDAAQLLAREKARLGATHCEIGAWLIGTWQLHSFMADAALYHHEPVDRMVHAPHLVKIVHLAEQIVDADGPPGTAPEPLFGLSAGEVTELARQAQESVIQIARTFEIETDRDAEPGPEETAAELLPETEPQDRRKHRSSRGRQPPKAPAIAPDAMKKIQLARAVRDITLLQGVQQNLAGRDDTDDILTAIERCLNILFGLKRPLFFLYDPSRRTLCGRDVSKRDSLVAELRIPVDGGNSLLSEALIRRAPYDSFSRGGDAVTNILDEQLIRLTHNEGILCLPMATGATITGALVCGVERRRMPRLEKQYRLMALFARLCARMLDSAQRRRTQAEGAEAESVALLQAQTRKIAHEVNNPLNIMKNYIQLLGAKLSEGDIEYGELNILNEEIDRVAALVRELSALPEAAPAEGEEVDVNRVIEDLIGFTEATLFAPRNITLQTRLAETLPALRMERGKLRQIFLNLFKNAAEAMPKGGTFTVSTRNNVNRDGADCVEIVLQDSGPGIPPRVMAHLFQPVSSTKGAGHEGLGLSIVKDLVSRLGGNIMCRSEPKSGTAFQVLLPKPESG